MLFAVKQYGDANSVFDVGFDHHFAVSPFCCEDSIARKINRSVSLGLLEFFERCLSKNYAALETVKKTIVRVFEMCKFTLQS